VKRFISIIGALVLVYVGLISIILASTNAKFVLLGTDALIFLLVLGISSYTVYAQSKTHLLEPWKYVFRRPLAMSALIILLAYVFIGLLDSIHFRTSLESVQHQETKSYTGDVISIFDVLTSTLKNKQEKSYSSPFATHLYVKETIETETGTVRGYPRLKFGGAHLNEPENDRGFDIIVSTIIGLIKGSLFWIAICGLTIFWLAGWRKDKFKAQIQMTLQADEFIPTRVILATFGVIVLIAFLVVEFADKYHVLGTDKVGQDVLYLALKSIRTGLVIGTLTTLIMLPFAVALGVAAGHFGGWVDDVVQYIYTTLSSIPGVLLIAAAILSLQVYIANNPELFETISERADLRLLFLCAILGITSWTGLCRLLRGETLKLRELEYVQAAKAFGVGNTKIITKHILPNVMHIVLIVVVLDFSSLVLAEAVLSYVGVGVDPSTNSWGNMINSARLEMAREPVVWWSLVAAFVFMFVLVLSANLFSDAVRDAFDPKVSRSK